jgi:DNA-binding NtrC family response regulator
MLPKILFVDDEQPTAELTVALVRPFLAPEATILFASSHTGAIKQFREHQPSLVVTDLSLVAASGPDSGFALIRELQRQSPRPEILVLTSHHETQYGIEALKHGAAAFLAKPPHPEHLAALINNGLNNAALRSAYANLNHQHPADEISEFHGSSAHAKRIRDQIRFAASSRLPLLITGESGTGKGLVAHAVHRRSRLPGKFVRYQANFVSGDLFASEMFGHTKGAFTGALSTRRGLLLEANEGTFFLDEIDELPLSAQVTLLGVLQDKQFRQLGSNAETSSQFRLISATNCPTDEALQNGKLRRDFFHRISAVTIHLPPLRERSEDIAPLATAALERSQLESDLPPISISGNALLHLESHSWPGNVRELLQEVQQAAYRALFRGDNRIEVEDISVVQNGENSPKPEEDTATTDFQTQVQTFKRNLVLRALEQTNNNQVHAARLLGIDRGSLRRILEG